MKRFAAVILLLAIAVPLHADFRAAERALRAELGKPMTIPFFGLARFITWIVHPHGVHDVQLAIWEKTRAMTIDGPGLEAVLVRGLPKDFQPIVRRRSKHDKEWTFIYARPKGDFLEILVLNSDRGDTVLVRAEVNADQLAKTIHNPRHLERIARR